MCLNPSPFQKTSKSFCQKQSGKQRNGIKFKDNNEISKIFGNTDKRSIYFRYSDKWLQDRILYRTFSNSSSYNSGTKNIREKGDNSEGGQFFIGKWGNPTSSGNSRRVHFDNIFDIEDAA
jgi:hypothetical protein